MGIVLALLSAACFGASDFAAGLGGRRASPGAVAILAQPFGLAAAIVAVILLGAPAPTAAALLWGAMGGVAGGVGGIALYRGFTVGHMSVVAPLSAVLTAALPAVFGLVTGDPASALLVLGLLLALPAIALVSQAPSTHVSGHAGVLEGAIAGAGFAVFFIALDRAGTSSGAWPLVSGEGLAVVAVVVLGLRMSTTSGTWAAALRPAVLTGLLGGVASLLYLAATGRGNLSVVAVVTALYPAATILLARGVLDERWSRVQAAGLVLAAVAVVAIAMS